MSTITILDHDPHWSMAYDAIAVRVRTALGCTALSVEHVGSTSVPGLAAKPVIDVTVAVPDSAREDDYVPRLTATGFELVLREPQWFEHRMLCGRDPAANVHIFKQGCPELVRMRMFRDWLRAHDDDAALYAGTKRALAKRTWVSVEQYAEAKRAIITMILSRALALATSLQRSNA